MSGILRIGLWTALAVLATRAHAGQLTVGSSASFDIGTGQLDLGCGDLVVAGTLLSGTQGVEGARDLTISPGGVLQGQTATLEIAGNWVNTGTFTPGASHVRVVDGCARSTSDILGTNTFAALELVTSTGKQIRMEAGATQTVAKSLVLSGAAGNRLELRSTEGGSEAFLNLLGAQSIDYVDVDDNHAVGNPIALSPNSVAGGNADGWSISPAVPAIGLAGLVALAAALVTRARRALAKTRAAT